MYDLIVIGAGPGGYVAAVRAAQLKMKVAVIEKESVGGVCLNWGCIPSKNLIHQADMFHALSEMEAVGVSVDRGTLNYAQVQANSRDVVGKLTGGVKGLLKRNSVEVLHGTARLAGPGQVSLVDAEQDRLLTAKNILVATGSRPMEVPGFECDEQRVLSSTGILQMSQLPESLLILGGGAIGCEFAFVMNSFGVHVTLVEAMDHLLPAEDFEVCAVLEKSFRQKGIDVRAATRASDLQQGANGVSVTLSDADQQSEVRAEKALVVFGRTPNTEELGLQKLGVQLDDRGYIEVGEFYQTAVPGIYAIGDVISSPALAHVASAEGEIAVEHIAGQTPVHQVLDLEAIPSAIYCEPQVAGFGLREDRALAQGIAVKKATFAYAGAGKTVAVGKSEGMVKILCDPQTHEIVGGHIVGYNATELVHELLLAKTAELLPEDITNMVHAHPTVSEAVLEAMRGIDGKPVHA